LDKALLAFGILMVAAKVAATIWLVRQPDATRVTATPHGRAIYIASKVTPALFVAAMLARAWSMRAPIGDMIFLTVMLIVAIVLAIVVVRQRAAGKWYGLAHDLRQRRRP
jgi:protein-S-isoprenylcysteine O-methyltransferase Ste14